MSKIVRTPTKATGGVTKAEEAAMAEHVKLWTARAMRTAPADHSKIIPAIESLYAAAGLKKPRVVIVPSPLVMAFAYGASAAIWHQRGHAHSKNVNATRNATGNATDNATGNATDSAEVAAAGACRDLAGQFGIECAARWSVVYQGGNMWAPFDCYLTAMRDIIGLRLPEHENYAHWEQAAIEGGFRVMHPEFCMVSDFPEVIRIDDQNLPHCEDGPSHRWRDGWSLYHWHGVKIPAEWIENKSALTAKMALTWQNIEQRRAACEIVTWTRILEELKCVTIDEDSDPEIGRLVQADIPDIGREQFLIVQCGTKRTFALPVPPSVKTALDANCWTYNVEPDVLRRLEART